MGWHSCSACDDNALQPCCEYSSERSVCDNCYFDITKKNCGKCGSNFCENHGEFEPTECCDQFLCKRCNEVGDLLLCDICCNEDGDEDDDDGKSEDTTKTVPPENNSRKRDGVVDEDDIVDSAKSNKKCKADADVEVIVVD